MELEHCPPEQMKKKILAIIGQHLDLTKYKVFIFGSRASGNYSARSDIDIGIEGPQEISKANMTQIKEGIAEIPTLYKIDVVDFTQVPPSFRALAKKHIELIS